MLPKAVGGVGRLPSRRQARRARGGVRARGRRDAHRRHRDGERPRGVFALGTFAGASHRLAGLAWGGEDLSADIGAETNRGEDGAYTEPYRLARALTLLGAAAARGRRDRHRLHEFPRPRRLGAPNAARRGATASSPRWRSIRRRSRSSTRPSRPPPRRSPGRGAVVEPSPQNPGAGVVGVDGEMLDRPHLKRAERLLSRVPSSQKTGDDVGHAPSRPSSE